MKTSGEAVLDVEVDWIIKLSSGDGRQRLVFCPNSEDFGEQLVRVGLVTAGEMDAFCVHRNLIREFAKRLLDAVGDDEI